MNRRELIRNVVAGTTTIFLVPSLLTSCEDNLSDPGGSNNPDSGILTIDLNDSSYSNLITSGGYVVKNEVIIINTGEELVALSSVCTHRGCQVGYNPTSGDLPCPCHGSVFSISGVVLEGPAPTPLKKYNVTREGDILTINLS
jgi:cytochrome b6-f complex iron-sulfur subunit